jgi:hypothetical protein
VLYVLKYIHFNYLFVGFEVLRAVVMKISIFWDITPSSLLKVSRCFGGTCHLHLQDRRISQLFFDAEDGGDMLLRNVVDFKELRTVIYQKMEFFSSLVSNFVTQQPKG